MELTQISDWLEWRQLWQRAMYVEQYMGLLHCGFDVPAAGPGCQTRPLQERMRINHIDRICFYLELADGWYGSDSDFLRPQEQASFNRSVHPGSMRAELARKAFAMLSQHFFRNTNTDRGDQPSWTELVAEEKVLEKVIWFFRLDEYERIPNLGHPNKPNVHEQRAREFVVELCKLGWTIRRNRWPLPDYGDEVIDRFVTARPHFVEMLIGSRHIDLLLDHLRYPLDEASWQKLEALALKERRLRTSELHRVSMRVPDSVEEAAANGSEAALVLIVLRALWAEEERLSALQAAVQQEREAKRRINELHSGG
ncbi:hypothetical protein KY386_03115 [Candidatus Parcubacteria bacterium]|nr:hypothetical protein [Candidatus Parcubacteria bacterium]